jgi:hypothetical protein
MKLRVRGNSIRLRLTKGEVSAFAEHGRVEDAVTFGGGARLAYVLAVDERAGGMHASFDGRAVTVSLPPALAREWASSERVGVEAEQRLDDGSVLRLLVEKDFACLVTRPGEDDSDAFANPNESCR